MALQKLQLPDTESQVEHLGVLLAQVAHDAPSKNFPEGHAVQVFPSAETVPWQSGQLKLLSRLWFAVHPLQTPVSKAQVAQSVVLLPQVTHAPAALSKYLPDVQLMQTLFTTVVEQLLQDIIVRLSLSELNKIYFSRVNVGAQVVHTPVFKSH